MDGPGPRDAAGPAHCPGRSGRREPTAMYRGIVSRGVLPAVPAALPAVACPASAQALPTPGPPAPAPSVPVSSPPAVPVPALASCAEVPAIVPFAPDGDHLLGTGDTILTVYWYDMAGTPRECVTLRQVGPDENVSQDTAGLASRGTNVRDVLPQGADRPRDAARGHR
jgi:hypothetical protein